MANKISDEKIQLIKDLRIEKGLTYSEIAKQVGVGQSTVERYLQGIKIPRKISKLDSKILEEIKRLYVEEKLGSTTISRMLHIGEKTVTKQLTNMGISLRGVEKKFDTEAIISMYSEKIPIHEIAKKLGYSQESVSKILKINNIEVYGHGIPKFNHHIFDVIDTEEKAYWLGFIFADGYVATINPSKPNYAFSLELSIIDLSHLEKFNTFMQFKGNNIKISKSNIYTSPSLIEGRIVAERCRWNISNKILWDALNSYGCTPRKTHTLQFPENKFDKSLIRHFIRGFFDGDGCISYIRKKHTYPEIQLYCKSRDFIEKVKLYFPIDLNIHSTKQQMYGINTTGIKAMKVLHYLYDDCTIYLDRKYERFNYSCRLNEESFKLSQTDIGESCNANPEINVEIKEFTSSYSVETEPTNVE